MSHSAPMKMALKNLPTQFNPINLCRRIVLNFFSQILSKSIYFLICFLFFFPIFSIFSTFLYIFLLHSLIDSTCCDKYGSHKTQTDGLQMTVLVSGDYFHPACAASKLDMAVVYALPSKPEKHESEGRAKQHCI